MEINIDPPIYCCHTDTLLSFDTIIHCVLLYFKCFRYHIPFSICSDSQLEVGFNARCKINRIFDNGDIRQHQRKNFTIQLRSFTKEHSSTSWIIFPTQTCFLKNTQK